MKNILDEPIPLSNQPQHYPGYCPLLALLLIGAVIATALSWWMVESIMGSGPTLSILGWIFLYFARPYKHPLNRVLGWLPSLVTAFWLSMIASLGLSPGDCAVIVPASLAGVSGLSLVIGGILYWGLWQ